MNLNDLWTANKKKLLIAVLTIMLGAIGYNIVFQGADVFVTPTTQPAATAPAHPAP